MTTTAPAKTAPASRIPTLWICIAATVDVLLTLLFAALGRESHHRSPGLMGVFETAWPFLSGLALAWLLLRLWRAPFSIWPAGISAWFGAVLVGMLLRMLSSQGTAPAFILVATLFLGAAYLLPRAIALGIRRLLRRRSAL